MVSGSANLIEAAKITPPLTLPLLYSHNEAMHVGVCRLRFRLPENFNAPYAATSVRDFWRRWHMTLSGWLRHYVFFPLGGSRGPLWKAQRNTFITLVLIGLFGGFYIVPLYALIQERSPPSHRSRIIAANNILNALFMVASAGLAIVLLQAGLSVPDLFLVTALMNAAVAVFIYGLVPEFLMRFLAWLLIHTFYRVEKENLDRIPETGPCVVVCNHVSFVDAVVIAESTAVAVALTNVVLAVVVIRATAGLKKDSPALTASMARTNSSVMASLST